MAAEPEKGASVYRLYWDRGSANMTPHAVLRELDAAPELVCVDVAAGLMPPSGDRQRHLFPQRLVYFANTPREELQRWWPADNYAAAENQCPRRRPAVH